MRWIYMPSSTTLRNWMTEYRLECASSAQIAVFGQSYFFGLVVAALMTTQITEKYGRKGPFFASRILSAVVLTGILMLPKHAGLVWS